MFAPTDPNAPSSQQPDAISAVKALQKASAAGQKIYQINQANMNQVLPLLHHDRETLNEIKRALNVGKDVTTHTDAVSIPGSWSGFGYIITDPVFGDGVYKISGGANGGLIDGLSGVLSDLGKGVNLMLSIIESDSSKFNKEFMKSPFFKAYNAVGKFLGYANLALDVVQLKANCGAEAGVVFSIVMGVVTVLSGLLASAIVSAATGLGLAFAPIYGLIAGILLAQASTALKNAFLRTRLCKV